MFDIDSFDLEVQLRQEKKANMLESARLNEEKKARQFGRLLEGLSHDYASLTDARVDRVHARRKIEESATIHAVREQVYNIFEAALVLDESAKAQYAHPIRVIFENAFDKVLKENNITTLKEFRAHIAKSSRLLNAITESANTYAANSANIFTHLLENQYNNSSTVSTISSAYRLMTEDTAEDVQKSQAVASVVKQINTVLTQINTATEVNIGDDVYNMLVLSSKVQDVPGYSSSSALFTTGQYIGTVENLLTKPAQIPFLPKYYTELQQIQSVLLYIASKVQTDGNVFAKLTSLVDRIDATLIKISARLVETGALTESSYDEIMLEADAANTEDKQVALLQKLKDQTKELISNFQAKNAIRHLKVVNNVMMNAGIGVTTGAGIAVAGALKHSPILTLVGLSVSARVLIAKSFQQKNLTQKQVDAVLAEAKRFDEGLDRRIASAKKQNLTKAAAQLEVQKKMLAKAIEKYSNKAHLVLKEEADGPIESMVESVMDAMGYMMTFEATSEDVGFIANVVRSSDDPTDEKNLFADFLHKNPCTQGNNECACMESSLYDQTHMLSNGNIPHSVHIRLQEGQYPLESDFLDSDEKTLVSTIAQINGKDKAVDKIKDTVVKVIQNEEKRSQQRAQEDQDMLNRMAPEDVNTLKGSIAESAGKVKIGKARANMPESLFESIVMSRSRNYITEAVSAGEKVDIQANRDTILSESIVLYTIHETFHQLGVDQYPVKKIDRLMQQYYYGK